MSALTAPAPTGWRSSVLIVDDQAPNREVLAGYLGGLSCTIRQVEDGEGALAAVAEEAPDLILLDVLMPGLNGFAVAQRLKSNPATATIPIVLITSLHESGDRIKGLKAGAEEFITKPVDRAELVARVSTLLRLKRLRDEREAVGRLGQRALTGLELDALMAEAAGLLVDALGVDYAAVWELLPQGADLQLWAGAGWEDGLVGRATVRADAETQMGYTLQSDVPIVVEDLRQETRFAGPPLLHAHQVTSGISVVIDGPGRRAGVLSVHTRQARAFTKDDVYFVDAVAQVLATAILRKRTESERLQALGAERVARDQLALSQRALAETTQAKSDFLATMSQGLRAPLDAILQATARLRSRLPDDASGEEQVALVADIEAHSRRLQALAEHALDLARLEAAPGPLESASGDASLAEPASLSTRLPALRASNPAPPAGSRVGEGEGRLPGVGVEGDTAEWTGLPWFDLDDSRSDTLR